MESEKVRLVKERRRVDITDGGDLASARQGREKTGQSRTERGWTQVSFEVQLVSPQLL